jgi:hypothetical protein
MNTDMNTIDVIQKKMMDALPLRQSSNAVVVPTHCIFPGGQLGAVSVRQGHNGAFMLSDDGQAVSIIHDACVDISHQQLNKAQELAKSYDASFVNGRFTLPVLSVDTLPAAIITLANLTQQWACELIYHHEVAKDNALKLRVYDSLKRIFTNNVDKEVEMIGHSNKPYKFDYRVKIAGDKYMLVDAINNHHASISAAFQRNYDVKKNANDNYKQEGIIENQAAWKGEDLILLGDVLDGIVSESNLDTLRKYKNA